jgi:hypothetical protein
MTTEFDTNFNNELEDREDGFLFFNNKKVLNWKNENLTGFFTNNVPLESNCVIKIKIRKLVNKYGIFGFTNSIYDSNNCNKFKPQKGSWIINLKIGIIDEEEKVTKIRIKEGDVLTLNRNEDIIFYKINKRHNAYQYLLSSDPLYFVSYCNSNHNNIFEIIEC